MAGESYAEASACFEGERQLFDFLNLVDEFQTPGGKRAAWMLFARHISLLVGGGNKNPMTCNHARADQLRRDYLKETLDLLQMMKQQSR